MSVEENSQEEIQEGVKKQHCPPECVRIDTHLRKSTIAISLLK